MKLHQLKALVAIADHGSIRAAAQANQVTPAAITKAMKELEADVEARLVHQQGNGAVITDAGRSLLVHARLVIEHLGRAESEMSAIARRPRQLRIAISAWVAMTYLADIMALFQAQMPDVRLAFYDGSLTVAVPQLRDGTLDLCIGRAPFTPYETEFSFTPLFRTTSAIVARRDHPLAHSRSLSQLVGAQWVLNWPHNDTLPAGMLGKFLSESGALVHTVHAAAIAVNLVRTTDMLSVLAWPLVETLAERERICALPIGETLDDVATGVLTRRGEPLSSVGRFFVECVQTVVRRDIESSDPQRRRVLQSIDDFYLASKASPPDPEA